MQVISGFLFNLYSSVTGEGIFLILLGVITIAFVINLILCLTLFEYDNKKRSWFYLVVALSTCLQVAFSLLGEETGVFVALIVALSLPYTYISIRIKKREKISKEKCSEIARFIDNKARDEKVVEQRYEQSEELTARKETLTDQPLKPSAIKDMLKKTESAKYGLDFSHVRKVLTRLDYFSLSPLDKRQIRELEVALLEAEQGDFTSSVKERLNDGLGSLLKIMSKHGI